MKMKINKLITGTILLGVSATPSYAETVTYDSYRITGIVKASSQFNIPAVTYVVTSNPDQALIIMSASPQITKKLRSGSFNNCDEMSEERRNQAIAAGRNAASLFVMSRMAGTLTAEMQAQVQSLKSFGEFTEAATGLPYYRCSFGN